MRRHLPALAAASALLALTACHPRALQRAAVVADLKAAEKAFLNGQPLPPLSADPQRYGIYRPVLDHFYSHVSAIQDLNRKIASHAPAVERCLGVDAVTDPSARRLNHQNLAALIDEMGEFIQQEDELAGPAADGIVKGLVPEDPGFSQEFISGMQQGRDKVQFIIDTFKLKQDYYRRLDAIIAMADQTVIGMSPDRKILFTTPEALAAYNAKVQELAAYEQDMNAKLRKVQGMGQDLKEKQDL